MTFYEFIKSFYRDVIVENLNLCIALIIIFICAWLVHLLIRPYRLWYWKAGKTGEIAEQLKTLNAKLTEMGITADCEETAAGSGGNMDSADDDENDKTCGKNTEETLCGAENEDDFDADKSESEDDETEGAHLGDRRNNIMTRGYDTDKQGKIYTEEEIVKLIKD